MLNLVLDTSPLTNGHAGRGIGMYTRLLAQSLANHPDMAVHLQTKSHEPLIRPDVIHYPFFDLFAPTLPLSHSAPAVVTIHDVIPLQFRKFYPTGMKGKLHEWRQRLALQKIKMIVTDSYASQQAIVHYLKVPESKTRVVYLAANPELSSSSPAFVKDVHKKYELPDQYILYVGDINYNKNIPELIKSLKDWPEFLHLVCVGSQFYPHDIPEWNWIESQLAASQVESRVHFLTDVKDTPTLAALYSGAVAYIQPSLAEGFGLPVLEAMQCQTPVISARNSSLIEIVNKNGLLVEPTAQAMTGGVKEVLDWSSSQRKKIISQAYQAVQEFTWQKTAQHMVEVYQEYIKR
jgi:glycosyltransferase involved in cell wall biosynthesis